MKTIGITVLGLVQGIGYRPYVAKMAEELNISGEVKNSGGIVKIIAVGTKKALEQFVQRLHLLYPKGAKIEKVLVEELEEKHFEGFRIVESDSSHCDYVVLPADLPTCEQCEQELKDRTNRRFHHPFISCVSCGPRFSIMNAIPYDRNTTSMHSLPLCEKCQQEYIKKDDRRRHAQTIACQNCGPELSFYTAEYPVKSDGTAEALIEEAAERILRGEIVAIKDIGGFHFAFLPTKEESARRLREFKHRDHKPFAIMCQNISQIEEYCEVTETERRLLEAPERPIVLLNKKKGKDFAKSVCGRSHRMGMMLPCNPLQILLLEKTGPLVMTSGNRGGEPIITHTKDMLVCMEQGVPDAMLSHNREIYTPLEDSIYQVQQCKGRELVQIIRRGRGLVPESIWLEEACEEEVYAAGGDLKSVFAYAKKNAVYLSSHFGDLDHYEAVSKREQSKENMKRLLDLEEKKYVVDAHPGYVSSLEVKRKLGSQRECLLEVFHHHAHIASVIAEKHIKGNVLGVAWDGTGYGADGCIWGSEFLLWNQRGFQRVGHLSYVTFAGGDAGAKDGEMSLLGYFYEAKNKGLMDDREWEQLPVLKEKQKIYEKALKFGIQTVASCSMGRFFDAIATLLGICHYNSYEGECAIELEQAAHRFLERQTFDREECIIQSRDYIKKNSAGIYEICATEYLLEIYRQLRQGAAPEYLACQVHRNLADFAVIICDEIAGKEKVSSIALAGGTFLNQLLTPWMIDDLEALGYQVFMNEKVPPGDGGLSLGQIYLSQKAWS